MWLYSSLLMNCCIILILFETGTFSMFSGAVGLSGIENSRQTSWCVLNISFCVTWQQKEKTHRERDREWVFGGVSH